MSRIDKINELIKNEVSKFLSKKVEDDLGLVTVLKVDTTKDLKKTDVWVSILGENEEDKFEELKKTSIAIQQEIAKKVKLRNIPKVELHLDKTGEYAFRIESLIKDLKK